jgi:hypothetical protein
MVAHDKNSRGIANDTKQEVIGKALQVHAAKIALAKSEGFRSLRSLLQIISQLGVKFVGELPRRNPLIVTHDLVDPNKPSDERRGASGSAVLNLLIKLLQGQTSGRIRFELGIAPERLGYALVLVVKDRWKRTQQVSCENGPIAFR